MNRAIIMVLMFITVNTFAQERMNLTTEQSATLRTKEMTLQLDLTEKQQSQVYKIHEDLAKKRQETRTIDRKELSEEERYEMRIERLDQMIAVKKEMKTILNEEQFEKWETLMQKRTAKMRKDHSGKENKKQRK